MIKIVCYSALQGILRFYLGTALVFCFSDLSIPSLESLSNEHEREDLEKMKSFIDASAAFEKNIAEKARKARETTSYPDPMTECKPPKSVSFELRKEVFTFRKVVLN